MWKLFAKPAISIMMFLRGCLILYRHLIKREAKRSKKRLTGNNLPLLGFIAAFIDVSGGGGWGTICTPAFILDGVNPRKAVGTVEFTETTISWVAVLTFGLTVGFEAFM